MEDVENLETSVMPLRHRMVQGQYMITLFSELCNH